MEDNQPVLPQRIALLLVGFFARTLTDSEHAELDEWITGSPDNQVLFEACVEQSFRPFHLNADQQAGQDEQDDKGRELLYTAELIIKHLKKTISEEEQQFLNEWADCSPHNKALLDSLPGTVDMEFLSRQLRLLVFETIYRENLN